MASDPVIVENTRSWLLKCHKDLIRVERCLSVEPPDSEDALFHCQQAVEKALKAFLTWHDYPFRKTHDLDALRKQCVEIDSTLWPSVDRIERLTPYAWLFRYPGAPPQPEMDAQEALALAREVVDSVLARLPEQVRP